MSKLVRRRWTSDYSEPAQRDRRPCDYEAYVPDRLLDRGFTFDGPVAGAVTEAEAAIIRFNAEAQSLVDTEALARILLRAEAVASSRIEGLEVGARRLLHAEIIRQLDQPSSDVTANEVLGNIDAMVFGTQAVGHGDPISLDLVLEIHQRLLAGSRLEIHGGQLRRVQNWIGGSSYNPCSAAFVPPPEGLIQELMEDLVAFCSDDSLPAVAQAAIAHAQFETIHPFVDANGRTGRVLIHLILRRRGLAPRVVPPISLILATWASDYITGLQRFRYRGPSTSREANHGANQWIDQFSTACIRAAADAASFEQRTLSIEADWRARLGSVRARSATDLLLRALPGAPVLTVPGVAMVIGRTFPAANNAVGRLVDAGILKQVTLGRRNRAYEAPEIITAFTDLERRLASPEGNTRTSNPSRRVPLRPRRAH